MREKITLEQFEKIRARLVEIPKQIEESGEDESLAIQLISEYLDLQKQLTTYDLSEIPFEAWEGIYLFADEEHPIDLSQTKANIDFNIVNYSGNGNFNGCNVRNLENIDYLVNPDSFDEKARRENRDLFLLLDYSPEFIKKYYARNLEIQDVANLSNEQIQELEEKHIEEHLMGINQMHEILGLAKMIELYNTSKDLYEAVHQLLEHPYRYGKIEGDEYITISLKNLRERLKDADIQTIKDICFEYLRQRILFRDDWIDESAFPNLYVEENPDYFLKNVSIPDDVKKRYYGKSLLIKDLLDYPEVFNKFPIDFFISNSEPFDSFFLSEYGVGEFQKLVYKYSDIFNHILEDHDNEPYEISSLLMANINPDISFCEAIKEYIIKKKIGFTETNQGIEVNLPEWLSSMNLQVLDKIETKEDLMSYNENTLLLNDVDRRIINELGIENIKRLENEMQFFSYGGSIIDKQLPLYSRMGSYIVSSSRGNEFLHMQIAHNIDFKKGKLSYEDFKKNIASWLNLMRKTGYFRNSPSYDWIQGDFREDFNDIFIDINAPKELKEAFYKSEITLDYLYKHPDHIEFLKNKNLMDTIVSEAKILIGPRGTETGNSVSYFVEEYSKRYGNDKTLKLLAKYGDILNHVRMDSLHGELDDEAKINNVVMESVYSYITNPGYHGNHEYLKDVPELVEAHPELFADFDTLTTIDQTERNRLNKAFYTRDMSFDDVKMHPELIEFLKDKNILNAFAKCSDDVKDLLTFGSETCLKIMATYGDYARTIHDALYQYKKDNETKFYNKNGTEFTASDLERVIQQMIADKCLKGYINYTPELCPKFLHQRNPELFLDDNAPEELKNLFYNLDSKKFNFKALSMHKEWLPYLNGKAIKTALLKGSSNKMQLTMYFNALGDKAIPMGIQKADTIERVLNTNRMELLIQWYEATGRQFIPDSMIIINFPIERASDFMATSHYWKKIMSMTRYSGNEDSKEAVFKLAYTFGVFNPKDTKAFRRLMDLLEAFPRRIEEDQAHIIDRIDEKTEKITNKSRYFHEGMTKDEEKKAVTRMLTNMSHISGVDDSHLAVLLVNLFINMGFEKFNIDYTKDIFKQIYRKNPDGSYSLNFNYQKNPKTANCVRSIFGLYGTLPIMTPSKAHQFFGGFALEENPEFREFLIANIDKLYSNPDYVTYLGSIQRQFKDIKTFNSNRALTFEVAINFVKNNEYKDVQPGNQRVAIISGLAGYSQDDFNQLQTIYNYGKQRVYSSIPRITNVKGNYSYELLKIDDPLAMAIGTLSSCCQELHNCAEIDMEHSMTDKHGRVFVIKDADGTVVAQSWVWRNKDVLCFDNIEIPNRAFERAVHDHGYKSTLDFSEEIYNIYKKAAHELIEEDEKVYRQLLEDGSINQEQYDGLRIGKVTVGLGNNDIATTLRKNAPEDKGHLARPLPYTKKRKESNRTIYLDDSLQQFILEERNDRKEYDGETLAVHKDVFDELDDSTIKDEDFYLLEGIERAMGNNSYGTVSSTDLSDTPVSDLGRRYGLDPYNTRIITHPNFGIVYEKRNDTIKLGALLFNTKVLLEGKEVDIEPRVVMQIRLALDQIANGKEIKTNLLDSTEKEMFDKAMALKDELDEERGINHGR